MIRRLWQPTHPVHTTLGLLLWALWFVVLYGGLSIVCAVAPPAAASGALTGLNGGLLLLTATVLALLAIMTWRCWRAGKAQAPGSSERFMARLGAGAHGVSALATLWIGLPVVVLPPCV
ncbi:hypothetical protein [Marinimicrobium alkaliphilum]|uniref:hypothetical protein n=1 Tax=Marinimicrobium alkaliphilum TaxID=2202654 RepID=UPI0018E0A94E|nr:hypothetical protein [Marinimicrobium alkaliphilum]